MSLPWLTRGGHHVASRRCRPNLLGDGLAQ
jgi:hypothetical protein